MTKELALDMDDKSSVTTDGVRLGEFVFIAEKRLLRSAHADVTLEPRVSEVLVKLISAPGPVSRRELIDEIWGIIGSDEALTQAISRLRREMSDSTRPYKMIKTVPRYGYELDVSVQATKELEELKPLHFPTKKRSKIFTGRRTFLTGLAIGALVMFGMVLIWTLLHPAETYTYISQESSGESK